jgi:carboxypeptidase C (cathepsin A)
MLDALIQLGLSEAQITYIVTQMTKGNDVHIEQTEKGQYYRMTLVKDAPRTRKGLRICNTFYFDMLKRYDCHIPTVETVIDLVQMAGFNTVNDDRLNNLNDYKPASMFDIVSEVWDAGIFTLN